MFASRPRLHEIDEPGLVNGSVKYNYNYDKEKAPAGIH